ncbi:early nodulin-20-like [Triticum dicoccoides]|uniref:early nodulin-20-like n=1 Tax=Triticum dicoccoides TaxID=85692 RepID=UPI00188ECCEA|nr:early nodulin-20-like [Triticum dicoccoides]
MPHPAAPRSPRLPYPVLHSRRSPLLFPSSRSPPPSPDAAVDVRRSIPRPPAPPSVEASSMGCTAISYVILGQWMNPGWSASPASTPSPITGRRPASPNLLAGDSPTSASSSTASPG